MNMTVDVLAAFPTARPLTAVERRTIVLVCNGLTNKEVACEMDTSEQVIKNRMRDIYGKTGANRRGELISRVLRSHTKTGLAPSSLALSYILSDFVAEASRAALVEWSPRPRNRRARLRHRDCCTS
jgi:DNA-binding CsgD family transcriptional regulator